MQRADIWPMQAHYNKTLHHHKGRFYGQRSKWFPLSLHIISSLCGPFNLRHYVFSMQLSRSGCALNLLRSKPGRHKGRIYVQLRRWYWYIIRQLLWARWFTARSFPICLLSDLFRIATGKIRNQCEAPHREISLPRKFMSFCALSHQNDYAYRAVKSVLERFEFSDVDRDFTKEVLAPYYIVFRINGELS